MTRKFAPEEYEAIYATHPNVVQIDSVEGALDVEGNEVTLDKDLVSKKLAELQLEWDSIKYQRDRATQYPSIQEQLDMQYWDAVNGTTKWKDAIAKVKTDNPKPSEQSSMANLVIKPTTNNSLKIQDQGGTERLSMNTSGEFSFTANTTFSADIETTTTGKVKQKGAFLQSSFHQALVLGSQKNGYTKWNWNGGS